MGYITVYLAHAVAPLCLISCISTLPVTGQFIMTFPLGKQPLLIIPGNVGYSAKLVPSQMVCPSFINCVI